MGVAGEKENWIGEPDFTRLMHRFLGEEIGFPDLRAKHDLVKYGDPVMDDLFASLHGPAQLLPVELGAAQENRRSSPESTQLGEFGGCF